jgi:multiple sugar transport system ATP-binding protein
MEAMSMADKIAVMNHGLIEQFGTPREIYDRPRSMYVANFMGSPPMNFLNFHAGLARGTKTVQVQGADVAIPQIYDDHAPIDLALGVRPEHVRLSDTSRLRGEVLGTEYLGTTQIVIIETAGGLVKARVPADAHVNTGETVGMELSSSHLSLFERGSGRAIETALFEEAAHG